MDNSLNMSNKYPISKIKLINGESNTDWVNHFTDCMLTVTIKRTTSDDPDFQSLVVLLDQDLKIRDGDDHAFYSQFNKTDSIKHAVVAYQGETPVGCGAFKPWDEQTAEIKRMFVKHDFRGKGIAQKVLQELETWASTLHYTACILETGINQPEAIRLYQKAGYRIMPNYGQYEGVENSVCMKKLIDIIDNH